MGLRAVTQRLGTVTGEDGSTMKLAKTACERSGRVSAACRHCQNLLQPLCWMRCTAPQCRCRFQQYLRLYTHIPFHDVISQSGLPMASMVQMVHSSKSDNHLCSLLRVQIAVALLYRAKKALRSSNRLSSFWSRLLFFQAIARRTEP